MLVLDNVSYRYAGMSRAAIRGISLTLAEGEIVGVVGASEAGKTTVCLVASGLAPRAIRGHIDGRLLIDGADTVDLPMHALATRVGICFQDPGTQRSGVCDTVYEEVAFGPMNLGLPRADVLTRTEESLETLGIAALAERDPARLSGGQMQLVAIAGLIAMRPAHLVLDEPTAQLDPAGTTLVGSAIERLASSGTSILITEHKTDLLARVCSRIAVLSDGAMVLEGAAAEVLADPRLPDLGVPEPSDVQIRRLVADAGLDPAIQAAARR